MLKIWYGPFMTPLTEPAPLWPEAPRYCVDKAFPSYRFTPGMNPHPTAGPAGHSYGQHLEIRTHLPPDRWRENKIYLFGIDLYHQGYFWESHESWEALWHLTAKNDAEGQFFQGLIQNAAAQLKVHLQQWSAAKHLSHEAWERLCFVLNANVCEEHHKFMGIDISDFLQTLQTHYTPLWSGENSVTKNPPRVMIPHFLFQ